MLYLILAVLAAASVVMAEELPAVSPSIEADARYLLTTDDLMTAQFGMAVEAVETGPDALLIRTTGAEFLFETRRDTLRLRQRLGQPREVAVVAFPPGTLRSLRLRRQGTGAVQLVTGRSRLRLRINADSLLMLQTQTPLSATVKLNFVPGTLRQGSVNVLALDEYGGVGSYAVAGPPPPAAVVEGTSVRQDLPADSFWWLSVSPPRPYDWQSSFRDRVAWHWSTETGYPNDDQIAQWSRHANILLQQSEVMLWKDWSLRFIPRNGIEEFRRVNETCARHGMRNIVYTSPLYFLTGTGLEDKAMNSFANFAVTGFSPGDVRGLNWPIFLSEIKKVMREYQPDGLYFDGIYANLVRSYLITRKAREVVGDGGLLEHHGTWCAPAGSGVYLPQVDTWFNFVLRGEGAQDVYQDEDYLRYFVSTWNISNAVGVLCNNNDYPLDEGYLSRLLNYNIRLHYLCDPPESPRLRAMQQHYWPALNAGLERRVQQATAKRAGLAEANWRDWQAVAAQGVEGMTLAWQEDFSTSGLKAQAPPDQAEPLVWSDLASGWRAAFSRHSRGALAAADGVLTITAAANTCAYLQRALPDTTLAVQAKFRCLAEGGASWGPGLLLRLGSTWRRFNTRVDNRLGVDEAGSQILLEGYPGGKWYWLRLRLPKEFLCYDMSTDGVTWRTLRVERLGPLAGPRSLIIGKLDNGGEGVEHPEPGSPGTSEIADVRVYTGP